MDKAMQGWIIYCDRQITRRKMFHSVCDQQGTVHFKSRWLGECIEYLDSHEIYIYQLVIEPAKSLAPMRLQIETLEQPKWQN